MGASTAPRETLPVSTQCRNWNCLEMETGIQNEDEKCVGGICWEGTLWPELYFCGVKCATSQWQIHLY